MNNNYCIIMAGGVGSRFWPYSRKEKPKQFLDFFGTGRSLLQMTYDRFIRLVPKENILIVSNLSYKDIILEQLPDIKENQVLLEPMRRNTAPCIAYATSRINKITNTANIIVAPSDHLILKEDEFIKTLETGLEFVAKSDSLLTLGIKPNRPETGYGYIQVDEGDSNLKRVKTFTEKPNLELAKVFVESGEFFWNSGLFLWNLNSINKAFNNLLPDVIEKFNSIDEYLNTPEEQQHIDEIYPSCHNISIDYGIMEKAANVHVLCSDFGWSDLGTWGSLYELSEKDASGNVKLSDTIMTYDCNNNVIVLPKGKLAVIEGLDDYIISESENVLLICRKTEEQRIRQFVNDASVEFNGEYI